VEFETNAAPEPSYSDPKASFADLNEDDSGSTFQPTSDFQEVDFGAAETLEVQPLASASAATTSEGREENMMRQELESVDFYIAQGYTDIAIDTLDMLKRQFGDHPDIESRRQKLAVAVGQTAKDAPGETPSGIGIDAGLAELFEEFRVAEEGEAVREDFETHYNMGTAYKEMDLIDEAIQEFQTSAALVRPGDGTSRFLQCCNLLGHCFVKKGMPEAAVMWFKKGLSSPGHSEDEYQALRYELASAYEELGDLKHAQQFYTEVYGVDVSYREVADKLSQLKKKSY
jgi:tetratricopeptide (TPR) repeat protein